MKYIILVSIIYMEIWKVLLIFGYDLIMFESNDSSLFSIWELFFLVEGKFK